MAVPTAVNSLQPEVLKELKTAGEYGKTMVETRDALNTHHGIASGILSRLHRNGQIARLSEKRNGCKVYVLPENVNGRQTEPQGRVLIDA